VLGSPGHAADDLLNGRYRLGEVLGTGATAEVRSADDERLNRPVAIKLLRPELVGITDVRTRFEAEGRASAALAHLNIVAIYDVDVDRESGHPYLVMERLPGSTLADEIGRAALDPAHVVALGIQVADALGVAHDAGIVHRDVKPGNVLHAGDGTWKVADFGIAKSTEALDTMTKTGEVLYTPGYVAPERLAGEPATAASDLYSLGVVLYEALSGRRPFIADSAIGVAHLVRTAEAEPLEEVRPGVDPDLARVVHTALAREPSQRFADAGQMREALAALRGSPARSDGDSSTVAVEVPSITQTRVARFPLVDDRPSRAGVGRAVKAALLAAAALLVVGLLSVAIGSGGDGGPGVGVTPPSAGVTTPPPDASGPRTGPMPLADALDRLEETVQP
jgi:non-specific serine/threonine protein kinase/serine/threonine-protein kinase